jgi:sialidase-1
MIVPFATSLALLLCVPPHSAVDVFIGGEGGYPAYRIPSLLVTAKGTVLAFAEGRATLADHAKNDIVLRRSDDGGATFGELSTVLDAGDDALNNPCAVEVLAPDGTRRVLLVHQRYPAGKGEYEVKPGLEGDVVCRTYVVESSDEGVTWSAPRDITARVKDDAATSLACGPGVGLQKRRDPHRGRVVIPFNRGPAPHWKVFAAYSDDYGATWTRGTVADDSQTKGAANEVQMIELGDGSLLLNARSMGGAKRRKAARSTDGGATWTPLADEPDLIEPQVMGSLLRGEFRIEDRIESRVLYAGPRSESMRVDGHLWMSRDDGATWGEPQPIAAGFFAYSCLAALPDGTLGVLYEAEEYRRIRFAKLTVDE